MAKTKIQLLEEIHELKKEDINNKDFYEKLYYDVRDNKISLEDAEKSLIVSETFYKKVEGKPIAENMYAFSKGKLKDDLKILKMVSSIITQLFIMKEQDSNFNILDNNYFNVLQLLIDYGNTNEIDKQSLANIITDLGCAVDKKLYSNKQMDKNTTKKETKLKTKKTLKEQKELKIPVSQNIDVSENINTDYYTNYVPQIPTFNEQINNNGTNNVSDEDIQANNVSMIQNALKDVDISEIIN